jgi:ATP-dependent Clp protease ATP-binding subunit ClpX
MYDIPSKENVSKVVVDEGTITGESEPLIIYGKNDQPVSANNKE